MSLRFEFTAAAEDGAVLIPSDITSRIRAGGLRRLRVVITSLGDEEETAAARGIDTETVDRVAARQSYDRDIALTVLGGEGLAHGTELGLRLAALGTENGSDR